MSRWYERRYVLEIETCQIGIEWQVSAGGKEGREGWEEQLRPHDDHINLDSKHHADRETFLGVPKLKAFHATLVFHSLSIHFLRYDFFYYFQATFHMPGINTVFSLIHVTSQMDFKKAKTWI